MRIVVNGKSMTCPDTFTLMDLIHQLGLSPQKIVAERNQQIVPAVLFAETALAEGDSLELLQFVGGG